MHFDPRPGALSIDEVPLEKFYTSGFCIDLSHIPLKTATLAEVQEAVAKSGQTIQKGDTVLVWLATNERLLGKPGYLHDFPGLCRGDPLAGGSGDRDVWRGGDQPRARGRAEFPRRIWPARNAASRIWNAFANLDKLIGRGRFRFIGFR